MWRWSIFGGAERGWHLSDPFSTYGTCLDDAMRWAASQGYELELPKGWWVYRRENMVL